MNLATVTRTFRSEEECLEHLEKMRWPDGVRCPTCGCDRISKGTRTPTAKNLRTRFYQCLETTCKQHFSATNGTIFHRSHLPLHLWFMAINIMIDAKKGMSALQLQRHLGIGSYKTAWYMAHRIRRAMGCAATGKLRGTVEIDETYVGGKTYGKGKQGRSLKRKSVVIGLRERGGDVRFIHTKDATSAVISDAIRDSVHEDIESVMTDDFSAYPKAMILAGIHGSKHLTIRHADGIFSDGRVHTNSIESMFALIKRGIVGSFHSISPKHLHRYLSEFEYRFNARKDSERFNGSLIAMLQTPRLTYRELVGEAL